VVSSSEINRWRVRDIVDNHIFILHQIVKKIGSVEFSIKERDVAKLFVQTFKDAGFTNEQISKALNMPLYRVNGFSKTKIPKLFRRAEMLFGDPILLLRKGDDYACEYKVTVQMTEYLIIEDLLKADWSTRQIEMATGFNRRRIQRIKKRIKDDTDE
jgi:hypothetical protein